MVYHTEAGAARPGAEGALSTPSTGTGHQVLFPSPRCLSSGGGAGLGAAYHQRRSQGAVQLLMVFRASTTLVQGPRLMLPFSHGGQVMV